MSYWDILTEDLQGYIINIRDEEIHKFKCGLYVFDCYNGHTYNRNIEVPIHIKKVSERHITLYYLVEGFCKDKILKMPKLKYDNNNIPFIKIKIYWDITPDCSEPVVTLYFRGLEKRI